MTEAQGLPPPLIPLSTLPDHHLGDGIIDGLLDEVRPPCMCRCRRVDADSALCSVVVVLAHLEYAPLLRWCCHLLWLKHQAHFCAPNQGSPRVLSAGALFRLRRTCC